MTSHRKFDIYYQNVHIFDEKITAFLNFFLSKILNEKFSTKSPSYPHHPLIFR